MKRPKPTTYDIFFHEDFDGIASAAVLLHFFKQRKDKVERLVPLDFDVNIKSLWQKKDALKTIAAHAKKGKKNPVVIVDFLYHPEAAWWFDHHPTTFLKESWEDKFRPSATHHLAPEYASACHLVVDALVEYHGYRPPKHIRDMAEWLDVCDGAQYRSARQTILMKEPALQINAYIGEHRQSGEAFAWLIKVLSEKGLAAAARDRRVRESMKDIRARLKKALTFYRDHLVTRKQVSFIDLGELGGSNRPFLRFLPYYLRPALLYTVVRMPRGNDMYKFAVAANPWKRDRNPLHIGSLLMKYGGGGHKNVGAVRIKGEDAAEDFTEYLITLLNNAVA
jgi:hypothetical protein